MSGMPVCEQPRAPTSHTDPQELARRMILGIGDSHRESAGLHLSGIQEAEK